MTKQEFSAAVKPHVNDKQLLTIYTRLPGQNWYKDGKYIYCRMDEMHDREAVIDKMFERLQEIYPDGIENVIVNGVANIIAKQGGE